MAHGEKSPKTVLQLMWSVCCLGMCRSLQDRAGGGRSRLRCGAGKLGHRALGRARRGTTGSEARDG